MERRAFLIAMAGLAATARAGATMPQGGAAVVPGYVLRFPEDEGSHPAFRTEWWYITGWLDGGPRPLGFQITFFRSRRPEVGANPSRFAPHHLLVAHAAIADPQHGRLLLDQRTARAGFGLAEAREGRTDVWIHDWSLRQDGERYHATIPARDFRLELGFARTTPPLLHGDRGFSQKGPDPSSASYYYTHPQLAVTGRLAQGAGTRPYHGVAWLDHEWSTAPMDADAVGWDWIGINLDDGGACMAFRMRGRERVDHWAAATLRDRDGTTRTFSPRDVRWRSLRLWRSPRTGALWPVAFEVTIGDLVLVLDPLMDDQEHDARTSAGTVYWEGAVTATQAGRRVGRGYLELTGYLRPLRL